MNYISVASVGVDILLLISLIYLGYRILLSQAAPPIGARLAGLEGTLRSLLREADAASHGLSNELMRRQQSLERLLGDINGAEQKLTRAIGESENKQSALEKTVARVSSLQVSEPAQPLKPSTKRPDPVRTQQPEPPSFEANQQSKITLEDDADTPPVNWARVNIFGEPIVEKTAPPSAESKNYRSLTTDIEREVEVESKPRRYMPTFRARDIEVTESVNSVARQAAQIAEVANSAMRSETPVRESRANSNYSRSGEGSAQVSGSYEATEASIKRSDPRLGVLGAMKRQVQTL